MEKDQEYELFVYDSNIEKIFYIFLDDEYELKNIYEGKELLLQTIEKLIYNENHKYSIYSEKFEKTNSIENYHIINFQSSILQRKTSKFLSFLKNEELADCIKKTFFSFFEKLGKKDFNFKLNMGKRFTPESRIYEKWINLVDFKNADLIYLSLHLSVYYNSKQNFHINLRINDKENYPNFLIFSIDNLNWYALNNENKIEVNSDLKFYFQINNIEKVNDIFLNEKSSQMEFKEVCNFEINNKLINLIKEALFENEITKKSNEKIFRIDSNKIRVEKKIEKFISNFDIIYRNFSNHFKNKNLNSQRFKFEKRIFNEKINEWYEILKFEDQKYKNENSNINDEENNNITDLQISKSKKIYSENLINFDRLNNDLNAFDINLGFFINKSEINGNINRIVNKRKSNEKNFLIHSYGIRNEFSEFKGDLEEKWWKWENSEFLENKTIITENFKNTEEIYFKNFNFKLKSDINLNLESPIYLEYKNRKETDNFIKEKNITNNHVIYTYKGDKRLKKNNIYEYRFEDICLHNLILNTYETIKKGYDKYNKWSSNFLEDKLRKLFYCKNYGFEKSSGSEWFETWTENPSFKYAKKIGKNNTEKWEEEWEEKYISDTLKEKNCIKKNLNYVKNVSWTENWEEIYYHSGEVSKSCKKCYYDNGILLREKAWGDILINELTNQWMKFNFCNNPFEDTKVEYFK